MYQQTVYPSNLCYSSHTMSLIIQASKQPLIPLVSLTYPNSQVMLWKFKMSLRSYLPLCLLYSTMNIYQSTKLRLMDNQTLSHAVLQHVAGITETVQITILQLALDMNISCPGTCSLDDHWIIIIRHLIITKFNHL